MFIPKFSDKDIYEKCAVLWNSVGAKVSDIRKSDISHPHISESLLNRDRQFSRRGGLCLQFKSAANDNKSAPQQFEDIHIHSYRNKGRPSLYRLAYEYTAMLGHDLNSRVTDALLLVSMRAELDEYRKEKPAYHNTDHYADVFAVTANFIEGLRQTDSDVKLSEDDEALLLIAAVAHDVAHPAHGNPQGEPYKNELSSFQTIMPYLKACGFSSQAINKVKLMILATSPNGPHNIVKSLKSAQNAKMPLPKWRDVDADSQFIMLEPLLYDKALLECCAMLCDADLYASAGANMHAQRLMSKNLTEEFKACGVDIDATTPQARLGFFDHMLGDSGFMSDIGRVYANPSYFAMRQETQKEILRPK